MKISTFFRHVREGIRNVFRNGWMTFASISAISISLFILGVFLIVALNVNHFANQIESEVEIRVHLDVNVPEQQVKKLHNDIGSIAEVRRVTFVSKDEAMSYMKQRLGEDGQDILEGYEGDNNPLNDSFVVEIDEPLHVSFVSEEIMKLNASYPSPPIFKIYYGEGTVEKLFTITKAVRNVGLILIAGLTFTAMFLIANTIKLTIIARRREIAIMKLVGATNGFIRWPFFIEGALLGITGSLLPTIVLLAGYHYLVELSRLELGVLWLELLPISKVFLQVSVLLLSIGFVIGVWGSLLSVRKFLKV